jgi:hypothetical protein
MHAVFTIALAVGLFGGAFLGYVLVSRIIQRIATLGRPGVVRACASGAGLLALVPAGFLAFVVGGNLGGAWAAALLGPWAIALGTALGVGLVLAACLCFGGVLGAAFGVIVSRALGKQHAA